MTYNRTENAIAICEVRIAAAKAQIKILQSRIIKDEKQVADYKETLGGGQMDLFDKK